MSTASPTKKKHCDTTFRIHVYTWRNELEKSLEEIKRMRRGAEDTLNCTFATTSIISLLQRFPGQVHIQPVIFHLHIDVGSASKR